ncbi:MAG TPA: insulinase family protein [Candidatus Krumholzibacteria bacterium]|nr:insulinase family protein [Candidatus Krumholzibacteria bacterium]
MRDKTPLHSARREFRTVVRQVAAAPHRAVVLLLAAASLLAASLLFAAASGTRAASGTSEELSLESGLRVLLLPHAGSGMVASNVFVGAGSTREENRDAGSSHFLEHVLFNGTERRTQEQIYAETDRIGAYNNATTKQEYTHYMMVAPSEKLAAALDIQADMLLHSTLPEAKFDKERGIVLEELSKDMDDPEYRADRALETMLYGEGSHFARPVLGTPTTLKELPRANVAEYYARQYVPSNMLLVLMGEFERDAALAELQRLFPTPSARPPAAAPLPVPPGPLAAPGRLTLQAVEGPLAVVELLAALPAGVPEDDALLALLAQIAGGSESSLLERALQQEPAVPHEPASATLHHRADSRLLELRVRLASDTAPQSSAGAAAAATEAAKRLLTAFRSLGTIGAAELAAAQKALLTQEVSQLEQLHYYAIFQGDRLWHVGPGFTPRYLAALEKADAAALGAMAKRVLAAAPLQIAAAGPGLVTQASDLSGLEPLAQLSLASTTSVAGEPERRPPVPLAADEPATVQQLGNGLTLVHTASASTRMFAAHLLVRNRSLREPADAPGCADLLHRSMAARIDKLGAGGPSPLERIGGTLKVADSPSIPYDDYYTTPLYSFVRLECLDTYYQEALGLLATMVAGPHDDAEALDTARKEMLSALQRTSSQPGPRAQARFDALLQPGHPLSRPVLGDAESLGKITPDMLARFAADYLAPDQLVLAVVGDVPREVLLPQVEATLGHLSARRAKPLAVPALPLTQAAAREELQVGGKQAALRLGRVVDVDPADRWALLVAASLASSRMQQDLRETRGLAYSLGISTQFVGDRASIVASMGTRPENLAEAEKGMLDYITAGKLQAAPDAIETAVNKYLALVRMRRITSMGQAFNLSRDLFQCGGIDYAEREAKGLMAVRPEDVERAAQRYLGPGPLVTVIAR